MKYLETYKPILTISKDGLHTLNKVILDEEVNVDIKRGLVELFKKAHFFLQQFCEGNETNQGILAEHRDIFLEYSHLDVGQIDLLCAIYSENRYLCESIPDSFLQKFISFIEVEGRQPCFLKFFKVQFYIFIILSLFFFKRTLLTKVRLSKKLKALISPKTKFES